jgi:hypothetical protein
MKTNPNKQISKNPGFRSGSGRSYNCPNHGRNKNGYFGLILISVYLQEL